MESRQQLGYGGECVVGLRPLRIRGNRYVAGNEDQSFLPVVTDTHGFRYAVEASGPDVAKESMNPRGVLSRWSQNKVALTNHRASVTHAAL
jgi:hypothetical protein